MDSAIFKIQIRRDSRVRRSRFIFSTPVSARRRNRETLVRSSRRICLRVSFPLLHLIKGKLKFPAASAIFHFSLYVPTNFLQSSRTKEPVLISAEASPRAPALLVRFMRPRVREITRMPNPNFLFYSAVTTFAGSSSPYFHQLPPGAHSSLRKYEGKFALETFNICCHAIFISSRSYLYS